MITLEKMRTKSMIYSVEVGRDEYQMEVFYTRTARVAMVEVSKNHSLRGTFDSVELALEYINLQANDKRTID